MNHVASISLEGEQVLQAQQGGDSVQDAARLQRELSDQGMDQRRAERIVANRAILQTIVPLFHRVFSFLL